MLRSMAHGTRWLFLLSCGVLAGWATIKATETAPGARYDPKVVQAQDEKGLPQLETPPPAPAPEGAATRGLERTTGRLILH